ncbi:hypothetical protein E3E26_08485 [Thermococcus sp. LS1]|uniref:hypothetical protein n=1 Tax=Thermococcus sp. LS1 TaxID=1638259 RepID=UPI00143B49A5|nr:hypothetical protein [Thermococcus sp. LS1]NJD99814.1 hypothetical protein [Thermococcus sp. LS1]
MRERLWNEITWREKEIKWRKEKLKEHDKVIRTHYDILLVTFLLTSISFMAASERKDTIGAILFMIGMFSAMGMIYAIAIIVIGHFRLKKSIKDEINELKKEKEKLEKRYWETSIEELARKKFGDAFLEKCRKKFREYSSKNNGDWKILSALSPQLEQALISLSEGDFITAKDEFDKAGEELKVIVGEIYDPFKEYKAGGIFRDVLKLEKDEIPCIAQELEANFNKKSTPRGISALKFASNVCHVLHYGDMEEARELLNDAQERLRLMREEKWDYSCGDIKFFQYLFEFHYFLLKAVVEAYEAEVGAVARATQEQAERFAAAKPVEVPETVEKVTVSAEEPEKELYRGEVRFKMGAMSQERVGMLVVTNKRLKLTGKYRLKGYVATVAIKAALRAAGIGEVYEDIPLKDINWLELKKALLGGYYLEFRAKGKKYTLYTDAAQHIYNLLKQYTNA